MKTIDERIKQEKRFWLDLYNVLKKSQLQPEWEVISQIYGRQKVWNKLVYCHNNPEGPAYYGISFSLGRIGSHELRFSIEMQDELKIGLRFNAGLQVWSEQETDAWEDLTMRLDAMSSKWNFDQSGWFACKKLPVSLNFRKPLNPAALDISYYQADSYARVLIVDEIFNRLKDARLASYTPKTEKVWSLC